MLPAKLIKALMKIDGFNLKAFEQVHNIGEQITSIRFNPPKILHTARIASSAINFSPSLAIEGIHEPVPWSQYGYYLSKRPSFTLDPLFHAGCYYVQEPSSMFLEQALKQTVDLSKPLKVLDLCAAPGGKSTHIQSLISKESLLVSNEVIRSRVTILRDNIIKWGCENVIVTNNDPKDFSRLENYFDVIVVDAPCSGSGLFRKNPDALTEWSENNVQLCAQRQQRILAIVYPALKKDGVLIYSTCSYSVEENEDIINWFLKKFDVSPLPLILRASWNIAESSGGYRFWPYKLKGEGFFLACFRKNDGEKIERFSSSHQFQQVNKKELTLISEWAKTDNRIFIKNINTVYAWPAHWVNEFSFLKNQLKVIYSGVLVGKLIRNKLVPDHALAMSLIYANKICKIELGKQQAISYLQRNKFDVTHPQSGWNMITFSGFPLGWINIIGSRINNYYPGHLRILREN